MTTPNVPPTPHTPRRTTTTGPTTGSTPPTEAPPSITPPPSFPRTAPVTPLSPKAARAAGLATAEASTPETSDPYAHINPRSPATEGDLRLDMQNVSPDDVAAAFPALTDQQERELQLALNSIQAQITTNVATATKFARILAMVGAITQTLGRVLVIV